MITKTVPFGFLYSGVNKRYRNLKKNNNKKVYSYRILPDWTVIVVIIRLKPFFFILHLTVINKHLNCTVFAIF